MVKKICRSLMVMVFVLLSYTLGTLTGYVVGYNDSLADAVAKYRVAKKLR